MDLFRCSYNRRVSDSISIDFGSVLPYAEEKLRNLFGRDSASLAAADRLQRHLRIAAAESNSIQIIGMDRPVSIFDIYQPTRLLVPRKRGAKSILFDTLLAESQDAVIVGGPGVGKTTLAQFVFAKLSRKREYLPVLITLRRTDSLKFLASFIEDVSANRVKRAKGARLVLLVDGYDELGSPARKRVAETLGEYAALNVGNFYLTCRSFYSSDQIKARRYEIAPFSKGDSEAFIDAFSAAYGAPMAAAPLVAELEAHGLGEFAEHPLMLALVCILKTAPGSSLPRTPIGLIRRAVGTLTFRWDEAKGIRRETRISVDGEDRLRCLMKIAYEMNTLIATDSRVQFVVSEFLDLLQRRDVNAEALLSEMAQWYGILVPTTDDHWTFVHRSIHDYLAAQYWVDAGFNAADVTEWNPRAAYAAALQHDATQSMLAALRGGDAGAAAFAECLYNRALFDPDRIATGVINHFRHHGITKRLDETTIGVETQRDFFSFAGEQFLYIVLAAALNGNSPAHQLVLGYSLAELGERNLPLPQRIRDELASKYDPATVFAVSRDDRVVDVRWSKLPAV